MEKDRFKFEFGRIKLSFENETYTTTKKNGNITLTCVMKNRIYFDSLDERVRPYDSNIEDVYDMFGINDDGTFCTHGSVTCPDSVEESQLNKTKARSIAKETAYNAMIMVIERLMELSDARERALCEFETMCYNDSNALFESVCESEKYDVNNTETTCNICGTFYPFMQGRCAYMTPYNYEDFYLSHKYNAFTFEVSAKSTCIGDDEFDIAVGMNNAYTKCRKKVMNLVGRFIVDRIMICQNMETALNDNLGFYLILAEEEETFIKSQKDIK